MSYKTFTIKAVTENANDISLGAIPLSSFDELYNLLYRQFNIFATGYSSLFEISSSSGFVYFKTKNYKGGTQINNLAGWTIAQRGQDSSDDGVIWGGYLTPAEINALKNPSRPDQEITDAEAGIISNATLSLYNICLNFFSKYSKVTNIQKALEYFLVYPWVVSGSAPQILFSNGSYISKVVIGSSNSFPSLRCANTTSSRYGVKRPIFKYQYSPSYSANYESNQQATITHPVVSKVFLASGLTDSDTINNAKQGKGISYINRVNSYTLNSNGEFVTSYGRYFDIRRYNNGDSSRFIPDSNTIDDFEIKEIFEDSDNTYPGGGDDKNAYPDEGSEDPGGESGKGDFDNTNDPIDFPTLPTFDVQSTGFISLWKPTITQLTDLYAFLWDSDISTTLKKLFNEPMNAIFSLGIIPVDPVTQGTRRLTIGHVDTEIDMESIQKQFVTFDFGSIDINEYYGAAWDYSPYTQASIYLPYIGVQPVDIDDIMNCTLTLRYNIDVLTGTTIALLKCVRKGRDNLNAVMYEWQGNCVTQCPITAGNWSQIMASVIQLGAMTGLALSQPVVGAIGSAVGSSAAAEYAQGKNLVNPTMATYGALNVLGSKVHVQRGGRIDMSAGAMSMQKAFVILNRPISGIPRGWNKYAGYPSLKIKTLGSQEGFVSVGAIKLDGLRATAEEINELDTILKTGVII